MKFDYAALTDLGQKRTNNEDYYLALPELGVFAVCDGMGGYAAGEIASKLACDEVRQFIEMTGADTEATWPFKLDRTFSYEENRLAVAIMLANQAVFDRAESDPQCQNMGTTFVGVLLTEEPAVVVAHAGDSRAYILSRGHLRRATGDHSLVEEFLRLRRLSPDQVKDFPQKNVILRALGQQRGVDVEVHTHRIGSGDVVLLCSDGLSGMLEDDQMSAILARTLPDLDAAAKALVDEANLAGGVDNITCVLVRWPPVG